MKNERRLPKILWVLLTIPLVSTLLLFTRLPENIPIHWNINGEIDRYVPKFPGAFFIPAICIVFLIVFIMSIPRISFEKYPKVYYSVAFIMTVLFLGFHFAIIGISIGADFIRMDFIAKFIIGMAIMFFGNIMPKFKPNEKQLMKSPWMAKAQRHGGFIWFLSGIILMVLAFITGTVSAVLYFGIIIVISIEPLTYSYLSYGRSNKSI